MFYEPPLEKDRPLSQTARLKRWHRNRVGSVGTSREFISCKPWKQLAEDMTNDHFTRHLKVSPDNPSVERLNGTSPRRR